MTATGSCGNPKCTCSPCTCADCRCGGGARLGELEQQVMQIIWRAERELTGRDVADQLPTHAYTTVATVLDRLTNKGLVRRRMEGRTIRFRAIDSESALAAQAIREALERTPDPEGALSHFVGEASQAERRALRQALADLDRDAATPAGRG